MDPALRDALANEIDAEAGQEALVAQNVHGRLAHVQVQRRDLRVFRVVAQLCPCPLTDQKTGKVVVGREGRVGRVDRAQGRVQRDDEDARVAGLLHGIGKLALEHVLPKSYQRVVELTEQSFF